MTGILESFVIVASRFEFHKLRIFGLLIQIQNLKDNVCIRSHQRLKQIRSSNDPLMVVNKFELK